jgi:predicted dehydrogenase
MTNKKLGVALVGLGDYATGQLAPALTETEHCYLTAIVTGSPAKAAEWKAKYNIPAENIYNYENFDNIRDNPGVDIVYIVLPNSLHAAYTIRAAKAGKHVICEKPMALSVEECDQMICACNEAGKMLSIGYRLHFDPYHLELARMGQQKMYGNIQKLYAEFCQHAEKGIWRLDKRVAGGGPLMDLGIYCLQAVMYTTGLEPVAVTAQTFPVSDEEKFLGIEETLLWQMELPGGLVAECKTSYSESENIFRADADNGWFQLEPAYNYSDLKGCSSERIIDYPPLSQQAAQMDAFALAIKNNTPSSVPGAMGRRDVKIIEAIYEAMRTGERVAISKD